MDKLTNRSRTFAEAVVTMVWLVLLALALNKPNWKSEVPGLDVPNFMLYLAVSTIITGICPLLACCTLENLCVISDVAALFSAVMLFALVYWMALCTVLDVFLIWVAAIFLAFMVLRISSYWDETRRHGRPVRTNEFHTILDGSHEFLCCMTGIHILWLESFALGGRINKSKGIQNAPSEVMGIANIICCAIGLCTMYLEMTPRLTSSVISDIEGSILYFDAFMIFSIGIVLVAAMWKSLAFPVWLLNVIIVGPLIVFFALLLHVSCPEEAGGGQDIETGDDKDNEAGVRENDEAGGRQEIEPPKLAPLGLTKLMVTGFLTVFISIDSPDVGITKYFLVFAAAAIVSGLIWRSLTQAQVSKMLEIKEQSIRPVSQARIDKIAAVAYSANTACFFVHTFVVIATVLLMLDICNAKQPMIAAGPAPAPACI